MTLEKGLRLGTLSLAALEKAGGLEGALAGFDRFYLGPEFCENLLDPGLCDEAAALLRRGKKVCLLTPMLSERGAAALEKTFARLLKMSRSGRLPAGGLEITVNDFGAAELARRLRLPFALNAGRLLRENAFSLASGAFTLISGAALDFFSGLGIRRFELSTIGRRPRSNFGLGRLYGFDRDSFRLTLHYPYLNLTTTRTCMTGMPDVPPEESAPGVRCARECRIAACSVAHPAINEKLIARGNTLLLEFPEKFYSREKELASLNVDRLVYSPFP